MKEIIIYEAKDGTRFDKKAEAEKYESMLLKISEAEKKYIGKRREDVERGLACSEHKPEDVNALKKELCEIAAYFIPSSKKLFLECGNGTRHISHAQRIVSDACIPALETAFYRLNCINAETGKEYEQPYYALHPDAWERHEVMYMSEMAENKGI